MSFPAPSLSIGGIACTILPESIEETWPLEGGPSAAVTFKCLWSQRYALAKALKGYSQVVGSRIVRAAPFQYPPSPNLYCLEIGAIKGLKPRTDATGWVNYQYALLPCVFKVPTWSFSADDPAGQDDPSGQPWTTTTVSVSAEVVQPPHGTYYFNGGASTGKPVPDGSLGVLLPQCEVTFKKHWMPYLPLAQMMALVGHVNDEPMTVGNFAFAAGTLLFANGPSQQDVDTAGSVVTDCEYKFLGRGQDGSGNPITWNSVLDPAGAWVPISSTAAAGGTPPYPSGDFTTLP